MKALVTGSSGFAGHHLVEHLRSCGDDVYGLDRSSGVDVTNASALDDFVGDTAPEVVYHLAGFADVGASWDDPTSAFATNATGTLNLLEAARRHNVERVLVVGSADIYGVVTTDELPLGENQALRPVSPYAASKVAADFLALQAWLGHGLPTIRARSFNHLGPGQSNRFVAAALAERVALAELGNTDTIEVGNVTPRRDFTDVRDVVRAYRLLMVSGRSGEAYHVCSGVDLAIRDLAEGLLSLSTKPLTLEVDPALQRAVDTPILRGDNSKIRHDVGWQPEIPLNQTLAELLNEARQRCQSAET